MIKIKGILIPFVSNGFQKIRGKIEKQEDNNFQVEKILWKIKLRMLNILPFLMINFKIIPIPVKGTWSNGNLVLQEDIVENTTSPTHHLFVFLALQLAILSNKQA